MKFHPFLWILNGIFERNTKLKWKRNYKWSVEISLWRSFPLKFIARTQIISYLWFRNNSPQAMRKNNSCDDPKFISVWSLNKSIQIVGSACYSLRLCTRFGGFLRSFQGTWSEISFWWFPLLFMIFLSNARKTAPYNRYSVCLPECRCADAIPIYSNNASDDKRTYLLKSSIFYDAHNFAYIACTK